LKLQAGQLIDAPFLPAIAEVKAVSERQGYWKLELVLQDGSRQYISRNLTAAQLAEIQVVQHNELQPVQSAEDFFLLIEAHRIRLAYQFDPQLAVSISQVDPLPHQIEAVYHYILQSPRIRFLIADDPGAGKTIMAGLVIKELQYRHLAQRVLIVAPGPPQVPVAAGDERTFPDLLRHHRPFTHRVGLGRERLGGARPRHHQH
jgi:hypothetical protein